MALRVERDPSGRAAHVSVLSHHQQQAGGGTSGGTSGRAVLSLQLEAPLWVLNHSRLPLAYSASTPRFGATRAARKKKSLLRRQSSLSANDNEGGDGGGGGGSASMQLPSHAVSHESTQRSHDMSQSVSQLVRRPEELRRSQPPQTHRA